MNYKERLETLRQKGILTEAQAAKLDETLHPNGAFPTQHAKRRWTIELVGLFLLSADVAALWSSGSHTMISTQTPQKVSETLNAPIVSGIGVGSTGWMIAGVLAVSVYLLFYLAVRYAYRTLWHRHYEQERLDRALHSAKTMQKELIQALERIRATASDGIKKEKTITIEGDDTAMLFAMQTQKELAEKIVSLESELAKVKETQARLHKGIFADLASLAGTLPKKEQP